MRSVSVALQEKKVRYRNIVQEDEARLSQTMRDLQFCSQLQQSPLSARNLTLSSAFKDLHYLDPGSLLNILSALFQFFINPELQTGFVCVYMLSVFLFLLCTHYLIACNVFSLYAMMSRPCTCFKTLFMFRKTCLISPTEYIISFPWHYSLL